MARSGGSVSRRWARHAVAALALIGALVAHATAQTTAAPPPPNAPPPASQPTESPWPLTIKAGAQTLTLYAPQLDSWDGFHATARLAVGVTDGTPDAAKAAESKGNDNKAGRTRFGVVELRATTHVDKVARMVTFENAEIIKSDFPSASAQEVAAWRTALTNDLRGRTRRVALDRLEAQLAISGVAAAAAKAPLRHDAPRVLFSTEPSLLVYVDGAPVFRPFGGTPYERLINTRPLVLRDAGGAFYLRIFDGWMSARTLEGPWTVLPASNATLDAAFKAAMNAKLIDPLNGQTAQDQPPPTLKKGAPRVFAVYAPTELVVTDGAPTWKPIAGTQLVYIDNTTGNVFRDTRDNQLYVLAAGRWFRTTTEAGPWLYVPHDKLPRDFGAIPDDSPKENAKASIAGTTQAREAAISATVPQTAAVQVSGTTMDPPRYDGVPELRPITGTTLEYVINSPTPVIRVTASSFYALQNGVWFTATSTQGPWTVALTVAPEIYRIPPGSPLYYVTFVRIYGYGTGVVYVGYTPGYAGTYVDPATGVVVHGTGYVYDPWTGAVWYGAPVTYGYGAAIAYTPWTGWYVGYGYGWYWGPYSYWMGWGWGCYPYWGVWGWPAYGAYFNAYGGVTYWGPGGWAGYSGNIYSQWGNRATVSRVAGGYNAWTGNAWATQVGRSYNSRTGVSSAGQRSAVQNVYTGNFAAGGRGIATGPQGNVAVGRGGVAGNVYTGDAVAAGRGAVYNKDTGEWTRVGGVAGQEGGKAVRVGDDVYAGKDGNVYRRTEGGGWEQHTPGGGWQPAQGGGGAAQLPANTGEPRRDVGSSAGTRDINSLDRDYQSRDVGASRYNNMRDTNAGLSRSYGGYSGGGARAGGRGGGRGGRR